MGGSSGGGSSSGEISYPDYMESRHDSWLGDVTTAMSVARTGASPFAGWTTVDPLAVFGPITLNANTALNSLHNLDLDATFSARYSLVSTHDVDIPELTDADIEALVQAENDLLTSEFDRTILQEFEVGMNNVNAIQTSAFVIGRGIILSDLAKRLAIFDADLRIKGYALRIEGAKLAVTQIQGFNDMAYKLMGSEHELKRQEVALAIELGRLYIAARLDVDKSELEASAKDRLFDLTTFQYGNNVMASIAGAAHTTGQEGSIIQNAMGGALSGAAAGAQVGTMIEPGIGTAIGAGVGALAGLAGSL